MVKTLQLMKSLCVAAVLLLGSVSAWAETTTLLEYGTADVPWDADGLATWTAGGSPTLADGIVTITGGNGSYATSKTISPTSGTIINLKAVWRGRSNTGRNFSQGNGSYFRFGSIYVAQNDQNQQHGYGFNGVDNIASVTTFTAGSYRVDITQSTWLLIEATINTAVDKLTSFTIKSEDGKTTYVSIENIALEDPDYTTIGFGYRKTGSVSTTNTEQLKSILITETTQTTSYANYTVHFVDGQGEKVKDDEVRKGEVGKTVNANNIDIEDYYSNNFKYVYKNDGNGVQVNANGTAEMTIVYTKYGKYTYNINAVDKDNNLLALLASATVYEDETKKLTWSKYLQVDDKWYVTSDNSFVFTATEAGSQNIVYKASDITYFFEMENLTRSGGAYLTEENNSYSGNFRLRLSKSSTYYTPALAAGVYRLIINCENSNNSESEVYVYTRSQEGTLSDKVYTHKAPKGSSAINTYIEVPEGYSIAFNGNEGNSNNNCRMDYMTLTKVKNEIVGALDYSTEANALHSSDYTIKKGETKVFTFQNHGTTFGNNWRIEVKEGETWKSNLCADSYDYTADNPSNITSYKVSKDKGATIIALDWDEYAQDMADAFVEAKLKYDENGTLYIYTKSTGKKNGYIYYVDHQVEGLTSDLTINLSVCKSWLEILSVETVSVSTTLDQNGYATFASQYPLDLTSIDGATAYSAVVEGTNIDFNTLSQTVPANTGMLLKGSPNATVTIPVVAEGNPVADNALLVNESGEEFNAEDGFSYFAMKKNVVEGEYVVFAKFNPATVAIPANKAYLKVANTEASRLTVSFNGGATGISTVEAVKAETEGIYNLNGQRVAAPAKGLYIVNGKKVVLN